MRFVFPPVSLCSVGAKVDVDSASCVGVLCISMLEEMNKMNDENATLREEKKAFADRLRQQQKQLQGAQTAARARQTATRYSTVRCGFGIVYG